MQRHLDVFFRRVSLAWGPAESFAFARRMSFSLEGTYFRKLLAESKTPEGERYTRNGRERVRDGE